MDNYRQEAVVIFLVQSCSHLAYLDYGSALFYPDAVCCPARLDGSTLPLGRQIMRTDRAPRKLHKEREVEPAPRKLQMKLDTRSPWVTTPLAPPLRPPPPHPPHPPHPHCPNFPPPVEPWVLRKKSRTAGLHLSSASRSPTRHFCFPFFVTSLALAHTAAC